MLAAASRNWYSTDPRFPSQDEIHVAASQGKTEPLQKLLNRLSEAEINAPIQAGGFMKSGDSVAEQSDKTLQCVGVHRPSRRPALVARRLTPLPPRSGWTAIHLAARFGHPEVVELLMRDGRCNPKIRTPRGETAGDVCMRFKPFGSWEAISAMIDGTM